jgi:hypothetical protein
MFSWEHRKALLCAVEPNKNTYHPIEVFLFGGIRDYTELKYLYA